MPEACANERSSWKIADDELTQAIADRDTAAKALAAAQADYDSADERVDAAGDRANITYAAFVDCQTSR